MSVLLVAADYDSDEIARCAEATKQSLPEGSPLREFLLHLLEELEEGRDLVVVTGQCILGGEWCA